MVGGFNPALSMETFGRVHPDHRRRGLGSWVVAWCEEHALARSPSVPVVRSSVPSTDAAAGELLEHAGYAPVRTFWHMTRDLATGVESAADPPGVVLRSYRHATDVRPTFDALEEAFSDHWASEPYPYEQHQRELAEGDPRLVTVAEADGEVVGVAIARTLEGDGWVDVLGVRARWRGRGIARALLLRAFGGLAELGSTSATLNVDAENSTGATRLYEGAGMRVHRAWTVFEKRFAGG
jgi:ribosomal protein S18 acetylase RimI-like enzyme